MTRYIFISIVFWFFNIMMQAQTLPVHPTEIINGKYHGVSKPLRDIPAMTAGEFHQLELKGLQRTMNKDLKNRIFPYSATALPKGSDPAWQDHMGTTISQKAPVVNFEGQTSPYYPPDCNGAAGPAHFMQLINTVYAIYDKTGALVAGPANLNLLFEGVTGANFNDGDPIILYDEQADRWLVTEFSVSGSINYMLMAVSTSNDPTGTWYKYSFEVATMPDYPKFSVWRDGYYMGVNNYPGKDIYVFERAQMLVGGTAQAVGFTNGWYPLSVDGFMCVPPVDNDGPLAPAGTPGMFIAFNDDALGGGKDQLWLYELTVNWTMPSTATFIRTQQLDVQPFSSDFGNTWSNIEQKGTSQRVDAIPQVIMNVPQYRNFGAYQTIVCCHTVNVDGIRHAGIRWYELRKTTGNWEVRQQGTYAPDMHSRWMGSIMLNGSNEIGLGYSVSSTSMYPGILFCGQSPAAYESASGILDVAEDTIQVGAHSQIGTNRWGDYSQMSVDPADDKTFWFTNEYIGSGGTRKTKIASFRYQFAPLVSTGEAASVTYAAATLNGTVNPNGRPTDYHFVYGLTPLTMDQSTPSDTAGTGSAAVNVSADITGLLSDTTYYFRIVATNSVGTSAGLQAAFTTLLAPFIAVDPSARQVPASAGNTRFNVTSNTAWIANSNASWCTVTAGGTDNDTIVANYEANISVASRACSITVSAAGVAPEAVTVNQAGAAPTLLVTPVNQPVSSTAGSTAFAVASNATWTAAGNVAWCNVTPSGSGNGAIVVDYTQNTADQPRVASISVTVSGLPVQTVMVTQAKSSIGIDEAADNDIQIFPNPSRGIFTLIPGKAGFGSLDVTVQDLNGKVVLKKQCKGEKEYQLDLSSVSPGTYNLIVKRDAGLMVKKLLIIK